MLQILTKPVYLPCLRRFVATQAVKKSQNAAVKAKHQEHPTLIRCKRPTFNLYKPLEAHCKFGSVPLASSGWLHKKAKGDWFQINATVTEGDKSKEMQDVKEFLQNSSIHFEDKLKENLREKFEVKSLTNIQRQGWPKLMENHHTLIAAETGCGKTICYLMPIMQKVLERKASEENSRKFNTPLAVILTPDRELATQIGGVIEKLSQNLNIRVKTILGGNTKQLMLNPDFEDVDIVVASVGALSKLVTTGIYRMDHVRHVVLDEADTLLDDSFSDKLVHFLKRFPVSANFKFTIVNGDYLSYSSLFFSFIKT